MQPATGERATLMLPAVSTEAASLFLSYSAAWCSADEHALPVLDQAGGHGVRALHIRRHATSVPLPSRAPGPNPVECVWLPLRERFCSHRLLDHDALVEPAAPPGTGSRQNASARCAAPPIPSGPTAGLGGMTYTERAFVQRYQVG